MSRGYKQQDKRLHVRDKIRLLVRSVPHPPPSPSLTNPLIDIPSFQKKVSERYRTPIENGRIFEGMIEITGLITQGGGRGNRGDMGELRDWMRDHGVGEEFGEVVGGGQF